jgi:hypothetical protein
MKIKSFINCKALSEALGISHSGPDFRYVEFEVDAISNSWDFVNNSPYIQEWRSKAGKNVRPETRILCGKNSVAVQRANNTGIFDKEHREKMLQKSVRTNKKNGTGVYDINVKRANSKKIKEKNLSNPESNPICLKIEYKGTIYYGWNRLKKSTGVTKHLYNKYYLNGIDPVSRIKANGSIPHNQQLQPLWQRRV